MTILGPNTNADHSLLSRKVLLCNGEDEQELRATLNACGLATPLQYHGFRSYRFWRYRDLTVVLSSMGTGPLEALLWEMLNAQVVEEMVLVGTAGKPAGSRVALGEAYYIDRARAVATGLDAELGSEWQAAGGAVWLAGHAFGSEVRGTQHGGMASIASTDLYYGLSPSNSAHYLPRTKSLYDELFQGEDAPDLIDMETAQFYALCRRIPHSGLKAYLAFKGAANTLEHQEQQNEHTFGVLLECVKCALKALEIDAAQSSV
ncbi:MAG TPA: hypothetical protein VGE52_16090 [Pirellulales bacterium]